MNRPLGETAVKRLNREWRHRTEGRLALLLDDVQTPFNVGAIVRTAAAERVEHLYLAGTTDTPTHPKARKLSMGTDRYLEWTSHATGVDAIAAARADGHRVVAIELSDGALPLHEVDLRGDVCLVIGHEDRGVSAAVLGACDVTGFIPQLGRVGSLNVAHAAAIAIYEARRQAWTAAPAPT
ncbi:MAG: TrmH family RNA methyltransferase [Acidimicrobiia bacterium]